MADNKNVIEILFGVKGGSDIGGKSGKLIKKQLEDIAKQIKIEVNINKKYFDGQVDALQKSLHQKLGNLKIDINKAGSGVVSSTESAKSNSAAKEQNDTYKQQVATLKELKKQYKELIREQTKLLSQSRNEKAYKAQLDRTNRLEDEYEINEHLAKSGQGRSFGWHIDEEQFENLRRFKDSATETFRVAAARAEENNKKLNISFKGATANAEALVERYKDLIKNNKEAAATASALEKEARKDLSKNPAKAAEQTKRLVQMNKEASATFSRLSVQTDTFGKKLRETFSNKIIQSLSYALIGLATRAIRQVYQNVIQLDKAVTDLQIATGKTREETKQLVEEYANMARQLGATITQVAEAADTFLRQGYSIAEANKLIKDSLMLSKLGQIDSATSSKALTSAMKGYKVAVEDATQIVDKFTAVDMNAAVSAGYIAQAMSETAVSANIAGISMDKLIGMISTVGEVTQDSAQRVGTFFKTFFARLGNVKAGKFIDDETGESLNDTEKVLGALGISLRDSNGQFRNFGTVLDDIAAKWNTYDNVQKRAIATAAAGTRQQEKMFVLFENYSKALSYANVSAESAGTAQSKYSEAYLNSIEAKIQSLTAVWQEFSASLLDSSIVGFIVDAVKGIASVLTGIAQFGDGILVMIPAIIIGFTALGALLKKVWVAAKGAFPEMATGLKNIALFTDAAVEKQKEKLRGIYEEKRAELEKQRAELEGQLLNKSLKEGEINLIKQKIDLKNKELLTTEHAYNQQAAMIKKSGATAAIMTILTILLTLNNAAKDWGRVTQGIIGGVTAIAAAVVVAIRIIDLGIKGFMASNPLGWILLAITAVVAGIKALVEAISGPSLQDLKDAAKEAKEAYEEVKNELDEVNTKLEETKERIEELNNIENPTIIEKDELERLKATNAELLHRQQLLQQEAAVKRRTAEIAAVAVVDKMDSDLDRVDRILGRWQGASIEDKDFVANIISDLSAQREQIEYYANAVTDEQKKANQAYETIWKTYDKFLIASGSKLGDVWDSLLNRENFKNSTEALKEFANSGEATGEALKKLRDSNPDVKKFFDYLKEVGWASLDSASSAEAFAKQIQSLRDSTISLNVVALTHVEILEKMQGGFDALSKSLKDIADLGILSANSMKEIFENYDGLQKYFTKTPFGFVLDPEYSNLSSSEILRDYINTNLQEYADKLAVAEIELERIQELEDKGLAKEGDLETAKQGVTDAQENLNNALLGGEVLLRSSIIEEETEKLNKQKDAYKNLIDIRKDLLKTFKQELDYQKQLAQKQKSVADLQTKLKLAQMDTSASGQARMRELEAELQKAQEEMDDFTLEHAIEVLTQQLDEEYSEYNKLIESQTKSIVDAINSLGGKLVAPDANQQRIDDYYNAKENAENDYTDKIKEANKKVADKKDELTEASTSLADAKKSADSFRTVWNYIFNRAELDRREAALVSARGNESRIAAEYQEAVDKLDELKRKGAQIPVFHSGGIVGGATALKGNEEFAKLLKGEIVTTPIQAQRFINKTLPSMISSGNRTATYNAPLIELNIASATKDSIPKIEAIVKRAVNTIKTDINSGINRNKNVRSIKNFTTAPI